MPAWKISPFFAAIGIKGRGKVYGDYKNENGIGKLKLSVSGAQFENDSFWGFPFPLTAFSGVRGAMDISGSRVRIIALSLEGKGIYARLKGDIKGNKADLMAEVMRDPAFVDTTGIFTAARKLQDFSRALCCPAKKQPAF